MESAQLFPGSKKKHQAPKANLITFHFSILLAFSGPKYGEQKRIGKVKVRTSPVFHQDLALALVFPEKISTKKTHQIHSSEISEIHSIRISSHDLEHDFMNLQSKLLFIVRLLSFSHVCHPWTRISAVPRLETQPLSQQKAPQSSNAIKGVRHKN